MLGGIGGYRRGRGNWGSLFYEAMKLRCLIRW